MRPSSPEASSSCFSKVIEPILRPWPLGTRRWTLSPKVSSLSMGFSSTLRSEILPKSCTSGGEREPVWAAAIPWTTTGGGRTDSGSGGASAPPVASGTIAAARGAAAGAPRGAATVPPAP